ncbi:TonB-dependent receptor [Shewanella avicenniae]|uniref:TonB-dependent receptor n=1 Tax=Shewanella avicenniae TaxID=2814294 RepID=A0ABX7QPZ5_9GAMM|nr:TonB-dependent receptor [Shewanella avicenniae]QSX33055.1 TonB-dependent receptor [Shewanella avicenniae]
MGFKPTSLAVLCALAYSLPALAEPQATTDEQMIVIGRQLENPLDIAANVTVIDATEIALTGATNLTEVLRGRAGIQISDSNNGAVFAMRGFNSGTAVNNTLILLDGRRLNNIDIAAASISAIPLNQIERVEILSGSAGVLYGDQAVGGVINIITKAPSATGGNISVAAGSYDSYEAKADLAGAINSEWRYFLAADYHQADNYRRNNDNETSSVLARVQYEKGTRQFFVEGSYYDNKQQTPGALTLDEFNADPRQASPWQLGDYIHEMTDAWRAHLQQQVSKHWTLAGDVNYSDSLVSSISYGSLGQNSRSLLEVNPKAIGEYVTDKGPLTLIIGADLHRGKADFDLSSTDRHNTQTLSSAYVQATVPFSTSVDYVIGGRYAKVKDELYDAAIYADGIDLDEHAHALEIGVNYRPVAGQRFYLRAEQNFRFAKVDEQAYTSPGVLGLKPQKGDSIEAGWDLLKNQYQLKLNLYRLHLTDEIVYDNSAEMPVGGAFAGANVNADESRRYGANLAASWQLLPALNIGAEYNYTDAEFTKGINQGKSLSWVAKHAGRVFTSYDIDNVWQLYAEGQYLGERYMEGDNANADDKLAGYWLANLALNYRRGDWQASLRADNLLDKDYASSGYYSAWGNGYYSGAGRQLKLTLGYRF